MWTALLVGGWLTSGPVVALLICRAIDRRDQQRPIDVAAVRADDALIEDVRAGNTPDGPVGQRLAAWRDDCR